MSEKLYTIPLKDAFLANDECPFCHIEKKIEEDLLDFVLGSGSSYMQNNVREVTDKMGFCRNHYQKMFQYGNTLGNAWILKSHFQNLREELQKKYKDYKPHKAFFPTKIRKASSQNEIGIFVADRIQSCYICNQYSATYERYLETFFMMYQKDLAFRDTIINSKGFCLYHFGHLCEMADYKLSKKEISEFYSSMIHLMDKNLERVQEDISWLIEKFDYRNQDADWKNSKDAIQRGMQKMAGGYPATNFYKQSK